MDQIIPFCWKCVSLLALLLCYSLSHGFRYEMNEMSEQKGDTKKQTRETVHITLSFLSWSWTYLFIWGCDDEICFGGTALSSLFSLNRALISSRKKIIRHPDSDTLIIRWWYKQYTKCLQRETKICWYTLFSILLYYYHHIGLLFCCINAFYKKITREKKSYPQ